MELTAFLSLIVAIIGLAIFLMADHTKRSEAGKLAYFAGLLVFLMTVAKQLVSAKL
jgi:hypothetical protein